MNKEVLIIGGGIIGLSTAYYLNKEGHRVTIVDRSDLDSGASYINAGYLCPSHIVPLSAPGVVKKGLKWMFNPSSPLFIKPRLDLDFLRWAWSFQASCKSAHVAAAAPVIRDISLLSQALYNEIRQHEGFDSHYEKKGLLMLCQTPEMLEEELKAAALAKRIGLDVEALDIKTLKKVVPTTQVNAIGATYYPCDAHSTPHEFMQEMKSNLTKAGVQLLCNEKVVDFQYVGKRIRSVVTDKRHIKADAFVLSAGAWTGQLAAKAGLRLLVQAGKGYRINAKNSSGISIPAILAEAKVAITPMNGFTAISGTMEISGLNQKIHRQRIHAMADAARRYYPELVLSAADKAGATVGLRSLSFDGLPYIGTSSTYQNLIIAAGHAMMGWTMGPATGKLVSEIISERKTSLDIRPFDPNRKP